MMKLLLLFISIITTFALQAQPSYWPKHFGILHPIKGEEVPLEKVLIKPVTEPIEIFSENPIDTMPDSVCYALDEYGVKFSKSAKKGKVSVNQRAYWQSKEKGSLFVTDMQIYAMRHAAGEYKDDEPFWLSIKRLFKCWNCTFATGVIEKQGNSYIQWTRERAIKRLTPITTPKEAVVFLYLMEGVYPINDFSEVKKPVKIRVLLSKQEEEMEDYNRVYTPKICPTQVIQDEESFTINLFYTTIMLEEEVYEVVYKLSRNGDYQVLSKRLIYEIPQDITGTVID